MFFKNRARMAKVLTLVFVLSQAAAIPVSAAVAQKTPYTMITAFEKGMKTKNSVLVGGHLSTIIMPEDEMSSYDLVDTSLNSKKIIATIKALRLAILRPPKYVKEEVVDGSRYYTLKGKLSQAGAFAAVQSMFSLIDIGKLTSREFNSLKSAKKNVSGGEVKMTFEAVKMAPVKVVLAWTTYDPRYKNKVVNTLTVFFSHTTTVAVKSSSSAKPATTMVAKTVSNGEFAITPSSGEPAGRAIVNIPDVVAAKPKAVNADGSGGVVAAASGDTESVKGRDNQRVNDLIAIKTALELFYNDREAYPSYSGLILGSNGAMCLNSDGFNSSDNCPYPYIIKVPADPRGGAYIYTGGGQSFAVTAKMEGSTYTGYKGNVKLTPSGLKNSDANF